MTDKQRFFSVWDAIEDTPQNAASMRARSGLMMSLTTVIRLQGAILFRYEAPVLGGAFDEGFPHDGVR